MQEYERLGARYRLQCERVVNESWGEVTKFKDEIKGVLEKTGNLTKEDLDLLETNNLTERDLVLLKIAADAFVQKVSLDERMDQDILNNDVCSELSLCGKNPKSQCPCARAVCLLQT